MNNIILFDKPPVAIVKCSFCNKQKHQVNNMFSNDEPENDVRNICNECVEKASQLIKKSL